MWQDIDLLVVPTAPTHYTIAAMQADPVVLNRNLGAYTNFVNLLDYAAISVPSCLEMGDHSHELIDRRRRGRHLLFGVDTADFG